MQYDATNGSLRCSPDELTALLDNLADNDAGPDPAALDAGVLERDGSPVPALAAGLAALLGPAAVCEVMVSTGDVTVRHSLAAAPFGTGTVAVVDAQTLQVNSLPGALWPYAVARLTGLAPRSQAASGPRTTLPAADVQALFESAGSRRAEAWKAVAARLADAGAAGFARLSAPRAWCLTVRGDAPEPASLTVLDSATAYAVVDLPVLGQATARPATVTDVWERVASLAAAAFPLPVPEVSR